MIGRHVSKQFNRAVRCAFGAGAVCLMLSTVASAQFPNKKSTVTFSGPVEIPGVSNSYFLKTGLNEIRKTKGLEELDAMQFLKLLKEKMKIVEMDPSFINRPVNEGYSGGEKKRNEILQMAILEPKLAILDEIKGVKARDLRGHAAAQHTVRRKSPWRPSRSGS